MRRHGPPADHWRMPSQMAQRADADVLLRDHLPLVGHAVTEIATRLPDEVGTQDLVAAGVLGLRQALRTFSGDRGGFAAHAAGYLRQALLEELRGTAWSERSIIATEPTLTSVIDRLETPAATADVAIALGIPRDVIGPLTDTVQRAEGMAGGAMIVRDPDSAVSTGTTAATRSDRCDAVNDGLEALPPRLRQVLVASFFDGRSVTEIARGLEVSDESVVQMRSEALAMLRAAAAKGKPSGAETPPQDATGSAQAARYASVASASSYRSRREATPRAEHDRIAVGGLGS